MNLDDPHDVSRPSWKLYSRLLSLGVTVEEASGLMDGYAHELAERQRAVNFDWYEDDGDASRARDYLADLIDPQVKP